MNLDCETAKTAEESLLRLLGINAERFQRFLVEITESDFEVNTDIATDRWLASKPVLIKFRTPGIKAMHLGAAFDYLLHRRNGWSLSCLSPCFSGEGRDVTSEQIIKAIPVVEATGQIRKPSSYMPLPPELHVSLC
jgi:hypothetical protein